MNDSSGVIKFVLIGGAAYVAYRYWAESQAPVVPVTSIQGPALAVVPPAGTQPVSTPPAATPPVVTTTPAYNSLDAIGARILSATGAAPDTADQFNVYLARELPADKTPPDPASVFTQAGWDRNATLTFAQWWGTMAPYLKSNLGLSGMGVLHGFGMYIASKQAGY